MAGRHPHGELLKSPGGACCAGMLPAIACRLNPSAAACGTSNDVHPPAAFTCFLPPIQVVHRVGRHFGFQAFNLDPRSEVREGAGLAERHLLGCCPSVTIVAGCCGW